MIALYIIVLLAIVGFAVFYICKEYIKKPKDKDDLSGKILKNKKTIESMVANVETEMTRFAEGLWK